ncbi:Fur family transcriptional regulator [Xylocopilactobacillus apis]|uniref:Transcriptional repressor n=1 Tax=Xylocopilactobacillus apis TaxID=2932183 RepID=A0AAU9DBZ5_9LACO|nr:Fur family transcriptional regulator [Xylocopilactobacillus apis]BDR57285.1 transcriptional repressor [Xylocopilactobacillus apis]
MSDSSFENALSSFKASGAKITQQRKIILKYLVDSHTHPTAKKIYDDLKESQSEISLATVYNTLDALIKTKLVIDIEDKQTGQHHFDFFGSPHYHIICDNCGKIVDGHNLDFNELVQNARNESSFLIKGIHVEVHGLCPDCQALKKQDRI